MLLSTKRQPPEVWQDVLGCILAKTASHLPRKKKKVDLASITTTWDVSLKDPAIIVILPLELFCGDVCVVKKIHRSDPPS